jgi:hypothetical protein
MSTLLEQASLVMIPSGYKEDVVYSPVPTDGSGDLSFTRASNGTRINSAGLVEVCPWNMITYSEQIDNPAWAKEAGNSIIADTTTAPNGTLTADTISVASSFNLNTYEIVSTNEGIHTYSVYLKKNVTNLISLYIYQTFGASGFKALGEINFDNGTFTASVGTGTIESVGNGWFRLTLTATLLSGANSCGFYTSSTTGTRTVYAWGAQLNIGSTAKPYFPTTDRLNVPRLTYQNGGGGCPSLLLEKQSTNLALYSEEFDNAYWTKNRVTITANTSATLDPSGLNGSDKVVETATALSHGIERAFGTLSGSHCLSVFAKAAERDWVYLEFFTGSVGYTTFFNLSTGAIGTTAAGNNAKIENCGNGWYRLSISRAAGSGTSYFVAGIALADNTPSYTGNGTSGAYFWGAQMEASSYPTSYIPTTSSSATRVADACFKTGIGSLFGANSGTIYFQTTYYPETNIGGGERFVYAQEDTSAGFIRLWQDLVGGTQQFRMLVNDGGTQQVNASVNVSTFLSTTQPSVIKWAMAYEANRFVTYINGVQRMIDTSGTAPTISEINFNNTFQTLMPLAQALVFPTALSDAELASLTTI